MKSIKIADYVFDIYLKKEKAVVHYYYNILCQMLYKEKTDIVEGKY